MFSEKGKNTGKKQMKWQNVVYQYIQRPHISTKSIYCFISFLSPGFKVQLQKGGEHPIPFWGANIITIYTN